MVKNWDALSNCHDFLTYEEFVLFFSGAGKFCLAPGLSQLT